jgi:hypothetical protein
MVMTQPLREVREQGLEACDVEEGRMMWALDSWAMETVDEVVSVGRRMPVVPRSRLVTSFFSLSEAEASLGLSSTAVGGGTRSGVGEDSLSGDSR